MLRNFIAGKFVFGAILALSMLVPLKTACANTLVTLHAFTGGTDGYRPQAGLIMDGSGNLYGTTVYGGGAGGGTVFELAPNGSETVLYNFCSQPGCADGESPMAGLIRDSSGNVYGTTYGGGNSVCFGGCGTVFKLAPNGAETVLHAFCSQSKCADGDDPAAALIMDGSGNLYGTTFQGGNGFGTVFKLAPDGSETVVHTFCAQGGTTCTDGWYPDAGLIMDGSGNLYGTTYRGGGASGGTVFEISPSGSETVLYNFCSQPGCTDGGEPTALIMDDFGNLYGTTGYGGRSSRFCAEGWCGTVFRLASDGTYTVLYSFCRKFHCKDGNEPVAGVIMDGFGNLFGTTLSGGRYHRGIVFKLDPTGRETVLHSFCEPNECTDGRGPEAGLILDASGHLYGTASGGGDAASRGCAGSGCGTVFKIKK